MTAPINFRSKYGATVQHVDEKNLSINDMVMLPYQLLTPELGVPGHQNCCCFSDSRALSLQNICVKITWGTMQELKSDIVITTPHSSISEFLNSVPSEDCMSVLKKAEIIVMCSKWHCHLECPVSPAVLLFCASYKLRLNNSLPLQLNQHELSQTSLNNIMAFLSRLSLLSTRAPLYSCMCCTSSTAQGAPGRAKAHSKITVGSTRHNRDSGDQIKPAETHKNTCTFWLTHKWGGSCRQGEKTLRQYLSLCALKILKPLEES